MTQHILEATEVRTGDRVIHDNVPHVVSAMNWFGDTVEIKFFEGHSVRLKSTTRLEIFRGVQALTPLITTN